MLLQGPQEDSVKPIPGMWQLPVNVNDAHEGYRPMLKGPV